MTAAERARTIVDRNDHMTLATADHDGNPWVSPVFYVPDDNYDLYWVSGKRAQHSDNIRNRPDVAVVIYEAKPGEPIDAVYISAKAVELNDPDEVRAGIEIMGRKPQPDRWLIESVADVANDGPWRIYRATPTALEARADGIEDGKAVVGREPAEFRNGG